MGRRVLFLTILILAIAAGSYCFERFPLWAVDNNGDPVTGAVIKAATTGTHPPTFIGAAAEEVGNGSYYFKIGSSTGELPSGYYDVYIDSTLYADWTNVYIGLGNVPPANSITSAMIQNGAVDLSDDVKASYGTGATALGNIYAFMAATKDTVHGERSTLSAITTNAGTNPSGTFRTPSIYGFEAGYETSLSDSGDYSAGLGAWVNSRTAYTLQGRNDFGTAALEGRALVRRRGRGLKIDVRNKGTSWAPDTGEVSTISGVYSYTAVDGTGTPAGIESRLDAKSVTTAYGVLSDIYAPSSVTTAYGGLFRNHSSAGTSALVSYGVAGWSRASTVGYGCYGNSTSDAAVINYGLYGEADSANANYAVYGKTGDTKTDWGGMFENKVGADSLIIPPNLNGPAGVPTRVVVGSNITAGCGIYVPTTGTGATGLWLHGGNAAANQYGLYIDGHNYGIYQAGAAPTNVFEGHTSLTDATVTSLSVGALTLNSYLAGKSTIAAGADTAHVTNVLVPSEASAVVHVTPVGREVDGGTWWVIVWTHGFTIHTTTNQSADQSFYWTVALR